MKKILAIVLALTLMFGVLSGCAAQNTPAPAAPQESEGEAAPAPERKETQFYSMASFNTGSFQYMYAAALAGELLKIHPEYNITAEATSGTTENLDLLYRGEVALSVSSPERLYNAYHGLASCGATWDRPPCSL